MRVSCRFIASVETHPVCRGPMLDPIPPTNPSCSEVYMKKAVDFCYLWERLLLTAISGLLGKFFR